MCVVCKKNSTKISLREKGEMRLFIMRDIASRVDELREEMRNIAHEIHENPELGNEEFHSVELLTSVLKKYGFQVERGERK